ncbi:Protein of unknown function DUF58 [Caminicella sporogenes DSM 14501]|uniref:DUF58 domain-containing protein n=1 Tax=Caminicella sporogenes DSM 14501 TaxID=1121266 RepID=A0A1M6PE96_9FIRM|nr:DUF58 domain-containing protein [Caminicella sporogenes]RKD21431.1 hypothetical protein BET04_08310 [Caminicella sporogenes]SHK06273.1 Protein of unknown function DUF58 [Caminicella sporogenes DSM 14501]
MEEFLYEIENLSIRPRKRLLRGGKGHHRGSGFGNSMDFYGHRQYTVGDDIKKVDWKAYLRTEDFYVKEFIEDKQLNVNIILDNSKSMDFGNPKKWEISKMISLGIGYITLKQMDILNVFTINDGINCVLDNIKGKDSIYKLIEVLSKIEPKGKTDFTQIWNLESIKPGITFIISDFFGDSLDSFMDYLYLQRNEIISIHILDTLEIQPEFEEELKLIDMETKDVRRVKIDRNVREKYLKKIHDFIEKCKNICEAREAFHVFALTNTSPKEILARALGGV